MKPSRTHQARLIAVSPLIAAVMVGTFLAIFVVGGVQRAWQCAAWRWRSQWRAVRVAWDQASGRTLPAPVDEKETHPETR